MSIKLLSMRMENIGGFRTTEFPLERDALLIGENNSGKTSLLRVLNWVLNHVDRALLLDMRDLSDEESRLLLPARETRNRARRLFLRVAISDGRSARKFDAQDGVAEVRIQFRAGSIFARLGAPVRGEEPESAENAVQLIERLQATYRCLYIPAARDGSSSLFRSVMRQALETSLSEGMIYDGVGRPAGAPKQVQDAASMLSRHAETLSAQMWSEAAEHLHGGFNPRATFEARVNSSDLVEMMIDNVSARFSLGDHDANAVSIDHLGAGLQSALAMALARLSSENSRQDLLLIEEPEAFLHPSAQRTIAQQVLVPSSVQTIATTHSAAILAEAAPSQVVVLRSHVVYPATVVDTLQEAKDQYFLSSWVHGAMFDRSLLLVEGPGDVAYLEALRRRLRGVVPPDVLNRMRVCAVGSKESFGPWLRLLRRFQNSSTSEQAFNVIVCGDSLDAGAAVIRALRESSIVVPNSLATSANALTAGVDAKNPSPHEASVVAERTVLLNNAARDSGVPMHFSAVDLEYSMLARVGDSRAREFARSAGLSSADRNELMSDLGSKGGSKKASSKPGAKAPYLRAQLAEWSDWDEISLNVKEMVWRWALGTLDPGAALTRPQQLN